MSSQKAPTQAVFFCRDILLNYYVRETRHPGGPSDFDLLERVQAALRDDDTPENKLIAIANQIRGVTARGNTKSIQELPNDAKVAEEDVPPEFREKKKPNGRILTTSYLIGDLDWPFKRRSDFTKAYPTKLTRRIKVGRTFAYLYDELSALWRNNSLED